VELKGYRRIFPAGALVQGRVVRVSAFVGRGTREGDRADHGDAS